MKRSLIALKMTLITVTAYIKTAFEQHHLAEQLGPFAFRGKFIAGGPKEKFCLKYFDAILQFATKEKIGINVFPPTF